MLIEAAKGGHTNVVSYLLDYPNNILSVPAPDLSQLTPPSQDASQVNSAVPLPWLTRQLHLAQNVCCNCPKKMTHFLHRNRFLVSHSKLSPW